ncbi:MAG: hypothetical protein FJY95_00900 [Candidatus Handelsmanbacteria bacterium]|nr:hypothetical protein [Candidatus Handelsmanbacteria bacterium]
MRRLWLLTALHACAWGGGQVAPGELQPVVAGLVAQVVPPDRPVLLVGLRDQAGKRSGLTRLLDEELAGAMVRAGADFALSEGEEDWNPPGAVPEPYWGGEGVLLAGQVHADSTSIYLRLQALDRQGGQVLRTGTRRLEGRALAQRLEAAGRGAAAALAAQVQLLVLREEGGFSQQVELADQGRLQAGDRLQLRFRTGTDCQVYAWLYSSAGQQQDLFPGQQVYKGLLQETAWLTLDEANQVHTLYFVAAPRLDEDKSPLFESLAELMSQGQVKKFNGIEKIDQVVGQYLSRYAPGQATVQVSRQAPQRGEEEKIILGEGTVLKSRALLLSGAGMVAQALSFEVQ